VTEGSFTVMDDFRTLDATALAELVRGRQVRPIELVEATILRIERLNPALNAVVTPMYDEARRVAKGDLPNGSFSGVPFLLKDAVSPYSGSRLTQGSAFLGDHISDHDSELVERLKRAGLIVLGKTNTPEFTIMGTTEPHRYGPTRNPWNTGRMAGGSSGGSAAAVAAGLVPMAHATDTGGSIRIPAACCGVFGLKPTRARNPLGPDYGDIISGLVVEHAVTRSVRDSAALLDATAGPAPGDPYWAPPPARAFRDEVATAPSPLRIAMSVSAPPGVTVHADCVRATHDAAALCAELGHEIVEAAPVVDNEMLNDVIDTVVSVGIAWDINHWARALGKTPSTGSFEPLTWAVYEKGCRATGPDYLMAIEHLQLVSRKVARFFMEHDLWLTPTVSNPPLPLGSFDSPSGDPLWGYNRDWQNCPFTALCNVTGQPAMSVPLSWNDEGLPVGVHFAGRFGDEATLFRLAAQLEQARSWATRRPPVHA